MSRVGLGQISCQSKMADKWTSSWLIALFAVSVGILHLFQDTQPHPYLDEVFHIPQAQKYCRYQFSEWDPKITTLPGLYLVSLLVIHGISVFTRSHVELLCSVWLLRATNVLFMIANAWILHRLLDNLHNLNQQSRRSTASKSKVNKTDVCKKTEFNLTALSLCTFPVLYFFTFLYYTDAGSTFFVLLMYYLSLKQHHIPASLAGVVAIIFRQTNVVWVVFVAGTTAARNLQPLMSKKHGTFAEIPAFVQAFVGNFFMMFRVLFAYGVVVVGFVVFVVVNGSIVVGDKTSHVACFNVPQLFYFVAFSAVFSSPLVLDMFLKFYAFVKDMKSCCLFVLTLFISLIAVYNFTYVHEYLLADNRHYPFYVWRKIYSRHWSVRYMLVPCYLLAGWLLGSKLAVKQSVIWQLMYWACVSLVLIPQKLFEFRYFILPYLLYRVHIPVGNRVALLLELVLYSVINAVTIYLFLNKPFTWEHEPDQIQRFMW